jgi:hypothetical protein
MRGIVAATAGSVSFFSETSTTLPGDGPGRHYKFCLNLFNFLHISSFYSWKCKKCIPFVNTLGLKKTISYPAWPSSTRAGKKTYDKTGDRLEANIHPSATTVARPRHGGYAAIFLPSD